MTEILVGSAGWSYRDWAGIVYPDPPPKSFDELEYLARFVDCIEVNSSFYRPPTAAMSESWVRRTPDRLRFTAKVWERFTHDREPFTAADARLYQEGIAPLLAAGRLDALLLQFPWSFQDGPAARDRIRRAADALRGWAPLVIELRHTSWLAALDFLRGLELNFCNIDQPKSRTSITGTRIVTGPVAYVRFHGRNAKAWFSRGADRDQKYDYLYSREELREWEAAIREIEAEKLFLILNNHFQGKGMANAFMLMRALGKELAPPPDTLRAAYPGLLP